MRPPSPASPSRTSGAAAVLVALLLVLTGCSSVEGTGGKGYVTADGTVRMVDEGEREAPVELSGEGLDGEQLDLADFRGTTTVVNVWGAWCAQCRHEMPDLVEAAAETEGIAQFVGINIRDGSTSQALSFNRKFGVEYPSFYSPDGKALLPFHDTIPPNAIPSTVVLDAEGRVAAAIIGVLPSAGTLVGVIEDVSGKSADE
ncbi:TlpA family protein disulfide reductase [Nocardioides sp. Y6]|uniref:TlpA family protein disulfide reductase n=1 Tax=Nocardioides malaquae TaxID=2773426 RepID=A0ABR9RWK4_9ACTN|nr:TlpA family protein disulfide reductase [Nocardioides malaquae]